MGSMGTARVRMTHASYADALHLAREPCGTGSTIQPAHGCCTEHTTVTIPHAQHNPKYNPHTCNMVPAGPKSLNGP